MLRKLLRYLSIPTLALATLVLYTPAELWSQSAAVIFGTNSGAAKAVSVDSSGYMDVTVGAGTLGVANGGTGAATSAAYTLFGNFTSGSAAPGFSASPLFRGTMLAGSSTSTQTLRPGGMIYSAQNLATGGANTNFTCLEFTPIPANTFAANGDLLEIKWMALGDATGGTKTTRVQFAYTSCANDVTGYTGGTAIINSATATTNGSWYGTAWVTRTAASTFSGGGTYAVSGAEQTTSVTTGMSATETSAIKIGMSIRDASSNAASFQIKAVWVFFHPAS